LHVGSPPIFYPEGEAIAPPLPWALKKETRMANKELLATTVELTALEFSEALRKKVSEMSESQDTQLIKAVSDSVFSLVALVDLAIELGEQEE